MNIGAVGFSPYIYNTNTLSGSSLSKVSAIGNDLTSAKTDYSSLTDSDLNTNPLRRGESADFFDILDMQMQMSRRNAARVMAPEESMQAVEVSAQEISEEGNTEAVEDFKPVSASQEALSMQFDRNLFQMQKAAEAYRVNMIA